MIVHSSFDRAHVRLVRLVRRRGLALLMCLFLLLVFLPGPCLGFRLALSHAVYLRMLLTCLEVAAIEVDFVAAKVIDLVVGLVNLTHVGASLEKVVGSLLLVLVRVRGLVVGRDGHGPVPECSISDLPGATRVAAQAPQRHRALRDPS